MILEVVTPEGLALKLEAVSGIVLPAVAGELGVLPGHRNGVFTLNAGSVRVMAASGDQEFAVGVGYAQISGELVRVAVNSVSL